MKQPLPAGMKGFSANPASAPRKKSKVHLWGIDAVMLPLMVALTILVIVNWELILFKTAQILAYGTVALAVVLVPVIIIGLFLAIRNKRWW